MPVLFLLWTGALLVAAAVAAIWGMRGAIVVFVGGTIVGSLTGVLASAAMGQIGKVSDLLVAALYGPGLLAFLGVPAFVGAGLGLFVRSRRRRILRGAHGHT